MFVYRRAAEEDAPVIAALGVTVWITTYAEDGVPPPFARYVLEHFTAERLRARIAETRTRIWLAEAEGGVAGFVELWLGSRTDHLTAAVQAEVARLYVLERFTRQGIGRALLDRCRRDALADGTEALWLSAYSENERARRFYLREGWREVGDYGFVLEKEAYRNVVFALPLGPQPLRAGP